MKNFKIIDLTHELHSDIPSWDMSCSFRLQNQLDYKDCAGEFKFRAQRLDMLLRSGTHIDAPSHCIENANNISQIPLERLIVDCVVINTSSKCSANYKISLDDIKSFENKYGTIKQGNFVIFHTGWSKFWNDPKKYHNNHVFPTIKKEVIDLLLQRDIEGIGIDTFCPDDPKDGFFAHKILLGSDKYIVENIANADKLPPVGSTVLIMPLPIQGATESPIRLSALIPNSPDVIF